MFWQVSQFSFPPTFAVATLSAFPASRNCTQHMGVGQDEQVRQALVCVWLVIQHLSCDFLGSFTQKILYIPNQTKPQKEPDHIYPMFSFVTSHREINLWKHCTLMENCAVQKLSRCQVIFSVWKCRLFMKMYLLYFSAVFFLSEEQNCSIIN